MYQQETNAHTVPGCMNIYVSMDGSQADDISFLRMYKHFVTLQKHTIRVLHILLKTDSYEGCYLLSLLYVDFLCSSKKSSFLKKKQKKQVSLELNLPLGAENKDISYIIHKTVIFQCWSEHDCGTYILTSS